MSPRPAHEPPPREYRPVEPDGAERHGVQRHRRAIAATLAVLALAAAAALALRLRPAVRRVRDAAGGVTVLSSNDRSANEIWQKHEGLKCYPGHGGTQVSVELTNTVDDHVTLEECQKMCLDSGACEGVMMVHGWNPGPCHLRQNIRPDECKKKPVWDLWTAPGFAAPKAATYGELAEEPKAEGPPEPNFKTEPCTPRALERRRKHRAAKPVGDGKAKGDDKDSEPPREMVDEEQGTAATTTAKPKGDGKAKSDDKDSQAGGDGEEQSNDDEAAFSVGDHVEGLFKGWDWYTGTVEAINADGTYVIKWDDDDPEDNVKSEEELRHPQDQAPLRLLVQNPCKPGVEDEDTDDDRFLEIPVKSAKKDTSGDDDDPVLRHQEPPAATEHVSGTQSLFDIVAVDIGQTRSYEVVSDEGAEVWSDRDAESSKMIGQLPKCTIFMGRAGQDAEWVRRIGGPGFVRMVGGLGRAVEEVEVTYAEAIKGSCEENGVWPIANGPLCKTAAEALGLAADREVEESQEVSHWANCYYTEQTRSLFVSSIARMNEIDAKFTVLCSTAETCFPTTTTSTTTVTVTTSTSTTVTTTTTTTSWGWPSVFCWSVVTPWGYEPSLVASQYDRGAGIFNCDGYAVLSGGEGVEVGPLDVITIPEVDGGAGLGNLAENGVTTNSFLNTNIFLHAWIVVTEETEALKFDWIAKVDPDAVFFPERLRSHLEQHMGDDEKAVYFMNCNRRFGASDPEPAKLFGSLEVFSKDAVIMYRDNKDRCMSDMHWQGWGEDFFMSHCMDYIGVGRVEDFWMLADNRCNGAPCDDTSKVSFHDFKDEGAWFWCWETSLGDDGVEEYKRKVDDRNAEQEKLRARGGSVTPRMLKDREDSGAPRVNGTKELFEGERRRLSQERRERTVSAARGLAREESHGK